MNIKKKFGIILLVLFSFLLLACDQTTTSIEQTQILDYYMFPDLIVLDKSIQLDQSDQPYYLYYYGDSCSHCIAIKQDILSVIMNLTEDQVFLVSVVSSMDVQTGINVTSTPSLVYVVNHQVSEIYVGQTDVIAVFSQMK